MEWKMEWNGNFGMEYGRCQNGMEWKISRMEWKTTFHTSIQARSQDLEKGGGFFERVRKVQTTLTRIFIVLESVSNGLSEN